MNPLRSRSDIIPAILEAIEKNRQKIKEIRIRCGSLRQDFMLDLFNSWMNEDTQGNASFFLFLKKLAKSLQDELIKRGWNIKVTLQPGLYCDLLENKKLGANFEEAEKKWSELYRETENTIPNNKKFVEMINKTQSGSSVYYLQKPWEKLLSIKMLNKYGDILLGDGDREKGCRDRTKWILLLWQMHQLPLEDEEVSKGLGQLFLEDKGHTRSFIFIDNTEKLLTALYQFFSSPSGRQLIPKSVTLRLMQFCGSLSPMKEIQGTGEYIENIDEGIRGME